MPEYDHLIVGAGFAGATCARVLAQAGRRVLVIDRRDHVGGNAADRLDEHGVRIHPYGPHVFHTQSDKVFRWLSRFTDRWQFMPAAGYAALFACMLDHPGIEAWLQIDFTALRDRGVAAHTIYTGPIDEYFGHRLGRLPYRSLRFEHEHLPDVEWVQPAGAVNFPNRHAYTRITEFKHLTGQRHAGTSIVREYPQAEGEPYYPIPRPENESLYQRYAAWAEGEARVSFVGRLAQYRYYNMDQVVAAALKLSERLLGEASG